MRPNQQNNNNKQRSRGRNNNNNQRRGGGGNPLSRNYESNGPDVKVRGNAAHIAEKYVQLARDATASGDSVMAENYLQHAEHYFRIILAAQAQYQPRPDQFADQTGEDDEDETENAAPVQAANANAETPEGSEQPAVEGEVAAEAPRRQQRQRRPRREDREPVAATEAPAEGTEAAAPAPATDDADAGDEKPRRTRRPRRTTRTEAGADLADAPQPDLPAFITSGREAAAE